MKKVIIRVKEIKGNCVVFNGGEKIVIECPEINLKETDKICIHALASLFFQPFTVPNKEFAEELLKEGHSVGLKDFLRIALRWRKYLYRHTKNYHKR